MLLILVVDFWRKVGRGGVGGWEGEERGRGEENFANFQANFGEILPIYF
jgi:hypothetical protein